MKTILRFTTSLQALHWLMAFLVISMLYMGLYMSDLPSTPTKFYLYQLHKSLGITLLGLVVLRIFIRLRQRVPETLPNTPWYEAWAAQLGHGALYTLLILMPLTGWLFSDAAGYHPAWFGHAVPVLVGVDKPWSHMVRNLHGLGAWLLIAVIGVHFAAAMFHHFIRRDATLYRMLPSWLKLPQPKLWLLALVLLPLTAQAAPWVINPASSKLTWQARFNGQAVEGGFTSWNGKIDFDPNNLPAASLTIEVATASIFSNDKERDDTLKLPDWFDASQFPKAVFTSSKISQTSTGYVAAGTLNMAGVTKPLGLPFTLAIDGKTAKANGTLTLSRNAFGIGKGDWKNNATVADLVTVTFSVDATQQ